jgi:LacI family transcriptional regulator
MGRVTIKILAAKLGVSVCTINKALTGKPRISEQTRERVIKAARKLGYQPNRLAQALARNPIQFGIVYPDVWQTYYGQLIQGIHQIVADVAERNVSAVFRRVPQGQSDAALRSTIRSLQKKGGCRNGIIFCPAPGDERRDPAVWSVLRDRDVPLVLLGTDLPDVPRLTLVRQDAYRSGKLAAEMLGLLTEGAPVAVTVGSLLVRDHAEKVSGFKAVAARSGLPLAGVYETQDDPAKAYPATRKIFEEHPEVRGVYIATDNSAGTCKYVREHALAGKVKLIATGIFPEVRSNLESGVIHISLFQQMREQGRLAARALYAHLAEHVSPPKEILVPPLIALRNNIDLIEAGEE